MATESADAANLPPIGALVSNRSKRRLPMWLEPDGNVWVLEPGDELELRWVGNLAEPMTIEIGAHDELFVWATGYVDVYRNGTQLVHSSWDDVLRTRAGR